MARQLFVALVLLAVVGAAYAQVGAQKGYHGEEEKPEHYKPAKKGYYHEEEEKHEHYKPAKKGQYHEEEEKHEHYKPAKKGYYHEEEDKAVKYEFELQIAGESLFPPPPTRPSVGDTLTRIIGMYWGSVSPSNKVGQGFANVVILDIAADGSATANAAWNIDFYEGTFKGSKLAAQGKIVWDRTGNVRDEFLITGGAGELIGATGTIVTSGTNYTPTLMTLKVIVPNREHHYAVGRFGNY